MRSKNPIAISINARGQMQERCLCVCLFVCVKIVGTIPFSRYTCIYLTSAPVTILLIWGDLAINLCIWIRLCAMHFLFQPIDIANIASSTLRWIFSVCFHLFLLFFHFFLRFVVVVDLLGDKS